jgi:hypothetical protein
VAPFVATAVDRWNVFNVPNVRLLTGNVALVNAICVAFGDAPGRNSPTNATNIYPVDDD